MAGAVAGPMARTRAASLAAALVAAATAAILAVAPLPASAAPTAALVLRGEARFASFDLSNAALDTGLGQTPLSFAHTDDAQWTLFYETASDRIVPIAGTPRSYNATDDGAGFVAEWVLEDGARAVGLTVRYSNSVPGNDRDRGTWRITLAQVAGEGPAEDPIRRWGWVHRLAPAEQISGLMEKIRDGFDAFSWYPGIDRALDMRNQTVQMFVKPTVSMYGPFYLSTAQYGVYVEGTFPGIYDLGRTNPDLLQTKWRGPTVTFRVFTGEPMFLVQQHMLLTGPPVVAPTWNFLPRRWRDACVNRATYYDGTPVTAPYNSELVEDILMFEALDIPMGGYWIDRPWAKGPRGYQDFEFDPERYPNAPSMVQWILSKNISAMLWIAPWVQGDMAREALQLGYNLPGQRPSLTYFYCSGDPCILVDFTKPAAVAWWQAGLQKVIDLGFSGFKLDRSEELVPASPDAFAFDGRSTLEVRNDYPVLFQRATYEACEASYPGECIIMPRATYTGSTRYSLPWGGDTDPRPEGLRAAIVAVQKAGMLGYPSWGSDTGGYGDPTSETLQRWTEFSAFNPIFSYGPTGDRAPWDMPTGTSYDIPALAVLRTYAIVHERLVPYTAALSLDARQTGMPIVRSLWLVCPREPACLEDFATFLYGPDILVGAIWQIGQRSRRLYLPSGFNWINAWDTAAPATPGGQWVEVAAALHQLPLFIRQGSGIELGDLEALYQQSVSIVSVKPDLDALQRQIPPPDSYPLRQRSAF